MKRKSEYIKAEVTSRSESGIRTYLITVTAPVTTLAFTDLLVERKALLRTPKRLCFLSGGRLNSELFTMRSE